VVRFNLDILEFYPKAQDNQRILHSLTFESHAPAWTKAFSALLSISKRSDTKCFAQFSWLAVQLVYNSEEQ